MGTQVRGGLYFNPLYANDTISCKTSIFLKKHISLFGDYIVFGKKKGKTNALLCMKFDLKETIIVLINDSVYKQKCLLINLIIILSHLFHMMKPVNTFAAPMILDGH